MDGRTRNRAPGPVSGIRYNMRGRGQPSETSLLNVGMRRTWGVPSGLPSEVRKVGLSTPRPFNPPSRTAIRLVVLIANGTSDFASERSLRWELSPVNSPSRAKDWNLSTKYCSLSMVDFELCRFPRMPAWGTIYVVRIWNGLDSIAGGRAWETMSQAEIMTCGPLVSNPLDPHKKGRDPCEESPRQREDLPFQTLTHISIATQATIILYTW